MHELTSKEIKKLIKDEIVLINFYNISDGIEISIYYGEGKIIKNNRTELIIHHNNDIFESNYYHQTRHEYFVNLKWVDGNLIDEEDIDNKIAIYKKLNKYKYINKRN